MGARRLSALAVIAAAAGLAVGVAGCGGTASRPAPSASISRGFVAQADELCALAAAHEAALAPSRIASLRDLARYAATVVPVARGFAAALGRLRAPAADRALWRRYLAVLGAQIDAEGRAGRAAAEGDRAGIRRAAATVRAEDPAPFAARLGLTNCARTGRTTPAAATSPA